MNTIDIRNGILSTPLAEESVNVPGWNYNLVIRELSGKAGSALIKASTASDGSVDQDSLLAGVVLATLRNADEPNKDLIFSMDNDPQTPNPIYKDQLMATGLGRLMQVAMQSIKLSGLDMQKAVDTAKNG